MNVSILRAKLHRATVTDSSLHYEGSLGIDSDFLRMTGLLPFEKILVGIIDNGNRFETYIIPEPAGSKRIVLNGAVAHLGSVGCRLTIMAFADMTPEEAATYKPKVLQLDEHNNILRQEEQEPRLR